ncbi:MAG: hypothetical protein IJR95_07075 [Lachnospiraceae bacterium]|nr:hypothetical protein [Lachnospiraceae bacterium]
MSLETLYYQVEEAIASLDFEKIWPRFKPLKFALYDNNSCFFDGKFIDKTDQFCANTSINFQGEQIAIWMVSEELEIPVLASKLVHEMFHGFQTLQGWNCWPREMEALFRYRYLPENLALKLRENELLLRLLDRFDRDAYEEFLACRKYRSEYYPYEFLYESQVEEIEGTANYVEWQVLKQLDPQKALTLTDQMRRVMTKPEYFFPIRISSYYTGALMINALLQVGDYAFEPAERPGIVGRLQEFDSSDGGPAPGDERIKAVSEAVQAYNQKTREIIQSALDLNEVVLQGPLELLALNIYDARHLDGFLTSTYFLMVKEGKETQMLQGNFVIKMRDEKTIDTVYRWKDSSD